MNLRILMVEDSAVDAELVERQLRRGGIDGPIERVETEQAFRDALTRNVPDIILADYHLPEFDGLSALAIVRELAPEIPFIFVSGNIGEERAVGTLRDGATDYVLKDRLTRLPNAVERAVRQRVEHDLRRQAEAALRDLEERFRYALIATHDLIWEWDVQAGTVWSNRVHSHERLLPETAEQMEKLVAFIHPDDQLRVTSGIREMLVSAATTSTLEYRIAAAGGAWRHVVDRHVILRDDTGQPVRVIGAVMDITEQKLAEEERNRLARRNALLLDSVGEGICGLDTHGRILFANASATRLLGRTTEDLLGRTLHQSAHHSRSDGSPMPVGECPILRAAELGNTWAYETVFWRADGTSFPAEIDCAPVIDDGRHAGVVVTFSDLSEWRQLERQLEQARRISDLGRLAATMAHEFNNVLMGIQPFVEILERRHTDPSVRKIALQLGRSTQRGKAITHEILRFVNDSELELTRFEVAPWLEALTEELRVLLGTISVVVDIPGEPLSVLGDASALHQVITNLVINARDAMPGGGTITVRARRYDATETLPFVITFPAGQALHLTVADTGSGMPPAVVERIFEPLFTTKRSGNGLGLAFAHRTVTRHGGQIFVESTPGRGTTFHIFLPLPEETPIAADGAAGKALAARVLVVDDDAEVAGATAAALDFSGFAVELVGTGGAVEGAVERFAPDLVILDIGLPDESGFSVYSRVAARWPALPVIFASGHIVDTDVAGTLGPNTASLAKPYRISELIATIGRLLGAT